jgi:Mrp family chromosome partitioning ATPase
MPAIKPLDASTTILARLPYVHGITPEAMLSELLKPEPVGASSALHQLTTTLEHQAMNRGSTAGVVLVTSAGTGEGKTLVSAALAAAFCHQGRRVFMMECNPSSPTLHQWFPRAAQGYGAYAQHIEALRYGHSNLFLLPGCDLPAHATNELLDGYRTWIERAKTEVDWIILDASPLLKSFANVAPLAPLATDVLIVNNPSVTTPAQLRAGLALLQPMMSSSALRGMVVNGG